MNHRPLSTALPSNRREIEGSLGSAVEQLTILQSQDTGVMSSSGNNNGAQSVQMERKLVAHNSTIWGLLTKKDIVGRITFVAILGCIAFTISLLGKKFDRGKSQARWAYGRNSVISHTDRFPDYKGGHASINEIGFEGVTKKLFATVREKFGLGDAENMRNPSLAASSISSSVVVGQKKHMPMVEAEALVKQWQSFKAEALGPSHQVHSLPNILDESMLDQVIKNVSLGSSCLYYWL